MKNYNKKDFLWGDKKGGWGRFSDFVETSFSMISFVFIFLLLFSSYFSFSWEILAQTGNKEDGEKKPKVFKTVTTPVEKTDTETEGGAAGSMRKTVPISPSIKIPPHFPHPPAGVAVPSGSVTGEEKKISVAEAVEKGKTSSGTSVPPPPPPPSPTTSSSPPAGVGQTGQQSKSIIGLSPEEEFGLGMEYKKKPKGFKFSFNINDYDLADLVAVIAKITGKKFILSAKVKQNIKATIIAPTPVTADEAFRAFVSVLEVNGLTIVPEGKFFKIVDSQGAAGLAVSTYLDGVTPEDARVITRIHKLTYGNAEDFAQILQKFKSNIGDITAYQPTNSLIMTDYGSNLKRLLKIIEAIDVAGAGEKIWIEPVHYGSATDLAQKLQEIMEAANMTSQSKGGGKGGIRGSSSTPAGPGGEAGTSEEIRVSKIIAEERTNSLIIIATQGAYVRIIELIKKLDVPVPGEGEIHVYYLQHADAEELAGTLSGLVQGMKGKRSKEGGGGGTALFEGEIKITHDKATNSLVVVSTARDFNSLRKVIDQLDIPRRQVFVEAIIMEVSLQKMLTLGVATNAGTSFKTEGKDSLAFGATTFSGLSTILIDPTSLMGLAVGLRGPEISEAEGILGTGISIPAFGVLVNALQTNNDVNILSTPHILATDNEEASITVGGNVPIQQGFGGWSGLMGGQTTGSTSGLGSYAGLSGLLGPMVSVGRQNVGLTLKIKPHINESDQIRFEIELEVSEVSGETSLGPLIDQRMAKTVSVVKDQQTVVLGGLITDNHTETIDKVPVLGDIPVLGYLFKKKKTRKTKRNLLIFMTPYIIRDSSDFRQIFNRKMEERREFIEQMTAFESKEYEPALDYSRTNGIVEEINKTLTQLEEEQKLLDELSLKPAPEHKAGKPVDADLTESKTSIETEQSGNIKSEESDEGMEGSIPAATQKPEKDTEKTGGKTETKIKSKTKPKAKKGTKEEKQ